jgi:hypothetical protein
MALEFFALFHVCFSGVKIMQRRSFVGICLGSSLLGAFGGVQTAFAKPRKEKGGGGDKGSNDPNGWVWSYTAKSNEDKVSGTFRVCNHEVFKDGTKVGVVDPQGGHYLGDKTVLILTNFGRLNGKLLLEKTNMKPPVWVGTLKAKDGTEWHFKAKLETKK